MTMNYTTLANYGKALLDVIRGAESLSAFPEDVRDGTITLGYGYTFIRKVNQTKWNVVRTLGDDLAKIGIVLTSDDRTRLEAIAASLSNGHKDTPAHDQLIADFTSRWCYAALSTTDAQTLFNAEMDHQVFALRNKFKSARPADGVAIINGLANTKELVAISSMFYNGPGLVRKALIDALAEGNRAEAWFQIRYGWPEGTGGNAQFNNGWAKRRYMESTVFGLYEDPTLITPTEAKEVYRMLQSHRDSIMQRENTYSGMVAAANAEPVYAAALAALGSGQVQTLATALDRACDTLLDDLAASTDPSTKAAYDKWSSNRADFDSTNLYLSGDANLTADASQFDGFMGKNDVLIVDDGTFPKNHTLKGGKGDDLLIGGAGDDALYGGEGKDAMAGGVGSDKYYVTTGETVLIEDKDGTNTILLDNRTIGIFYRDAGGTNYTSYDGNLTAVMQDGELIINDQNGTQITLNQDFQEGDFGITFKDKPVDPVATNEIGGDIKPDDMNTGRDGIQGHFDAQGNLVGTPQPYADVRVGTTGADHIVTGELNDVASGGRGDDWIETGSGNDWLQDGDTRHPDGGNDRFEGGDGSDILHGGTGDDQL
jgi:hypothetical protein